MALHENALCPYLGIIDELLPGLGFFGAPPQLQLSLQIDAVVDRVEVAIAGPRPEFLNIQGVSFFGQNGTELPRPEICRSASLSTIYGEAAPQAVMQRLLAGGLLHTQQEERPSLQVQLNEAVYLARLAVANRADAYGRRSRYIEVSAFLGDEKVFQYRNDDERRRIGELSLLLDSLGLSETVRQDRIAPDALPSAVHTALLAQIEAGRCELGVRGLIQLLPVHDVNPEPKDFHLTVCAEILLKLLGAEARLETARMKFLANVLDADDKLDRLQAEASRLRTLRTGKNAQVVISKHHVHEAELVAQQTRYLDALDKLFPLLQSMGVTPMLCYGSLLGAVREGRFLAHDDDVDVLYFDGSASREEAVKRKLIMIERLGALGYNTWDSGENFNVWVDGVPVDVFFCWQQDGRLSLMMESYKYRDIDGAMALPPSMLEFQGRVYPVLADPAAFLEERYGSNWQISDPYHEWPWTVRKSAQRRCALPATTG